MKATFILILFFFVTQLQAQKVIEKQIEGLNISSIIVDGSAIFKIKMNTSSTKMIVLQSKIEGEYNEDIVLITETKNSELFISTKFQPLFVPDNDKLSAHKVISIELNITIPEYLNVFIQSDIASVITQGKYNNLTIELINGNCNVDSFSGNATINTIHGSINIKGKEAIVKASTKKGFLIQDKLKLGDTRFNLNSINGNITISKTE